MNLGLGPLLYASLYFAAVSSGSSVQQVVADIEAYSNPLYVGNSNADVAIPADVSVTIDGVPLKIIGAGRCTLGYGQYGVHVTGGTGGHAGVLVDLAAVWPDADPVGDTFIVEVLMQGTGPGTYSRQGAGQVSYNGSTMWGSYSGYWGWGTNKWTPGSTSPISLTTTAVSNVNSSADGFGNMRWVAFTVVCNNGATAFTRTATISSTTIELGTLPKDPYVGSGFTLNATWGGYNFVPNTPMDASMGAGAMFFDDNRSAGPLMWIRKIRITRLPGPS